MTAPASSPAGGPASQPGTFGPRGRSPAPSTMAAALRLVPSARPQPARAPFVALIVAFLAAGLVGLLVLNTVIAENSFRAHDLQARGALLDLTQQRLQWQVNSVDAPAALAVQARKLGMIPDGAPAFIRLSDGKVLGVPTPAAVPSPMVFASPGPSAGAVPGLSPGASSRSPNAGATSVAPGWTVAPAPAGAHR